MCGRSWYDGSSGGWATSISDHGPAFLKCSPVGWQSRHEPKKKAQTKFTMPLKQLAMPYLVQVRWASGRKQKEERKLTLVYRQHGPSTSDLDVLVHIPPPTRFQELVQSLDVLFLVWDAAKTEDRDDAVHAAGLNGRRIRGVGIAEGFNA